MYICHFSLILKLIHVSTNITKHLFFGWYFDSYVINFWGYYLRQLIWIFSIHFFWKFAERVGKSQEKEIRERKTNGREGSRKSKYMRCVYTGLKKKIQFVQCISVFLLRHNICFCLNVIFILEARKLNGYHFGIVDDQL